MMFHWVRQSRRLLQLVNLNTYKPCVLWTEFLCFSKLSSPLCTKAVEELKAANLDEITEDYQGSSVPSLKSKINDGSDEFGNLKMSLEKQKKLEKYSVNSERKLERRKRRNHVPQNGLNASDSSDNFGDLSESKSVWYSTVAEPEPGDDSTVFYPTDIKYKSPEAYLKQMKLLVKERKLKEALELFPDMKRNNVIPIHANFTFMIGACGRVGYTEMAFKLLKQMTDRGLRPTPATLTGVFNSCAECPFPEYGLQKAKLLKEKVALKNWLLTKPTYHAMIKAFGKCGDILAAFQIADEMVEAGVTIDLATCNFLLMSCISNKEAGFTHAIEVWRKLLSKKLSPNIFSFNLLLRAVRDCGVGPEETSSLLLQHWSSYTKRPYGLNRKKDAVRNEMLTLPNPQLSMLEATKLIKGPDDNSTQKQQDSNETKCNVNDIIEVSVETSVAKKSPQVLANLLAPRPITGPQVVDLLAIQTASDRLALLGGAECFLNTMSEHKTKPDIKTFMLLLESSPPYDDAETALISLMDAHDVKPDTDFFNILIKRRNIRRNYNSAKQVLLLINKYNLSPDIVTFGVLALGCYNKKHGMQLLRDMKRLGCHANVEIMGPLIHNSTQSYDFEYLRDVLQEMKYQRIKPNEKILTKVEETLEVVRKAVIDKEQGKEVDENFCTKKLVEQYYAFSDYYSKWLKDMEMESEEHPWDQYKAEIIVKNENF